MCSAVYYDIAVLFCRCSWVDCDKRDAKTCQSFTKWFVSDLNALYWRERKECQSFLKESIRIWNARSNTELLVLFQLNIKREQILTSFKIISPLRVIGKSYISDISPHWPPSFKPFSLVLPIGSHADLKQRQFLFEAIHNEPERFGHFCCDCEIEPLFVSLGVGINGDVQMVLLMMLSKPATTLMTCSRLPLSKRLLKHSYSPLPTATS